MDRNLASGLALAATAAIAVTLAASGPGTAYADDITLDNAPCTGSRAQKVSMGGAGSSARPSNTLLAEGTDGSLLT